MLVGVAEALGDDGGEGMLYLCGRVEECVAKRRTGGDQQQRVGIVAGRVGVLLHDRISDRVGEPDAGRSGGHRGRDSRVAFRGDGGDDRVFATGVVVVVGPWRDPCSLGDLLDANILGATLHGQPKSRLAQCLTRCLLLSLSQPVVSAHGGSLAHSLRMRKLAYTQVSL